MSQQTVLRDLTVADYPALALFCASFPGEQRPVSFWLQRFQFWWEQNPAFAEGFPRGCLLMTGDTIGGVFALIPKMVAWQGNAMVAANMSCWRVLPEWRSRSLGLFFHLMGHVKHYPIMNTTPTPDVEVILQRVPFIHFTAGVRMETVLLTLPVGTPFWRGIKDIYHMSGHWSEPSDRKGGPFVGVVTALKDYGQQMRLLRRARRQAGSLSCNPAIGPEFDVLWEQSANRYALTEVRAMRVLEWFLQRNPNKKEYLLLTHTYQDRLCAFALFRRERTGHWPDTDALVAVDVWGARMDGGELLPLMGYAVDCASQMGVHVVRIPHYHRDLARALQGVGWIRPLAERMTGYYVPATGCAPPELDTVYVSGIMGDAGL
ncbi:MAG: hypothetical protein G8237_11100 [Magnetococcales bacterium]|nr:hypothetical protein [Magnetococcales bacterium]NGZ06890.1 hypothetical protein [Magnetococcales bacterium]